MPSVLRRISLLGAAALFFSFAGCDAAAPASTFADARASGAQATGSGHFVDTRAGLPEGEQYRTFSFNAKAKGDGAQGRWNLNARSFPIRIRGDVECISVAGNEAWFAGTTTGSDDDNQIGVLRGFYVVDNGEGRGAVDQISFAIPLGDAQSWCDNQLTFELTDIENGNVQVR